MRKLFGLMGVVALVAWMPACSAQDTKNATPKAEAKNQVAAPAAAAAQPTAPIELKTQKDKVSYAIGLNFGRSLKQDAVDIDVDVLAKAMKDAISGAKPQMTDEQIRDTMMAFQKEFSENLEKRNKELAEKNKKSGKEFMEKNAKEAGVKALPSGVQIKTTKEGTGASPKPTDKVKVVYTGWLLDGTQFDSSQGEAVEIGMANVIPGWQEGLQQMKVGGEARLWIPGEQAYSEFPPPGSPLEPFSTLVFDVKLVDIVKETPKEAPTAPAMPGAPAPAPAPAPEKAPAPAPAAPTAPAK